MSKERVKLWGAPGTGKTTRLIKIVEEEMVRGIQPEEIVFSSFTRAATQEARERTLIKFGGSRDDYPYFNTEHSICYRLLGLTKDQVFNRSKLKAFGDENGYRFSFGNDNFNFDTRYQEAMLQTLGDYYEFFVQFMKDGCLTFDDAYYEFIKSGDVPTGFNKDGIKNYISKRNIYKNDNKLWDFADMIRGVIDRGLIPPGMRVLILDEAQDMSKLLWELGEMWAEQAERVYLAGDPLQTLYFWSGANPELFFNFEADEEILKVSHRLTKQVKGFAEKIIKKTDYPFPSFVSSGREGVIKKVPFDSVDWPKVNNSFLLIRTRYLISKAVEYFISMGIPFISERGMPSPLVTSKGRAFHTILRLKDNEAVSVHELVVMNQFVKKPFLEHGAKAAIKRMDSNRMFHLKFLPELGFTKDFMLAIKSNDFHEALNADPNFNREDKIYLLTVYNRYGRKAFETTPKLTITTIHGSKGREKDDVYLMPDMTTRVWDGYMKQRDHEALVYYVAATRPINNLTILIPQTEYFFLLPEIK